MVAIVRAVLIHLTDVHPNVSTHSRSLLGAAGRRLTDTPTPSSPAPCPDTEGCCPAPRCLGHGSRAFQSRPGHTLESPDPCSCQGSDLRGLRASCSGLPHPTPEEVLEVPSLVAGINIASVLYVHNCAASPRPPPDPTCQAVSFELDLFSDPDIQVDIDWLYSCNLWVHRMML